MLETKHHNIPKSRKPDKPEKIINVNEEVAKKSENLLNQIYIINLPIQVHQEYHQYFNNRSPYEILCCVLTAYDVKQSIEGKESHHKILQNMLIILSELYPVKNDDRNDSRLHLSPKENIIFYDKVIKKTYLHNYVRKLFRSWRILDVINGRMQIRHKDMVKNSVSSDLAYAINDKRIKFYRRGILEFHTMMRKFKNPQKK